MLNEAYSCCPACTRKWQYVEAPIRPLPSDARLTRDPDGVDWNEYYWRDDTRRPHERKTILRPLPRSITDRIPQELADHILGFLRWETRDLYTCALVCRAWYHRSQALLCSCIIIQGRSAYDAVAQYALRGQQSKRYLAFTRMVEVRLSYEDRALPPAQRSYAGHIPLTLGGSVPNLQCLEFFDCLRPPYHSGFAMFMACFTELMHLMLASFELGSFADLRRLISSLPKLRELELGEGRLTSTASAPPNTGGFPRPEAPRLSKLQLRGLDPKLLSWLASWTSSTNVCKYVTDLSLKTDDIDGSRLSVESFLRTLGPSLTHLDYNVTHPEQGNMLNPLVQCTHLSNLHLRLCVNSTDSWQGVVTALYDAFSPLSSTGMRSLELTVSLDSPPNSPTASARSHKEFGDIDMGPIHGVIARSLFTSLKSVRIRFKRGYTASALTSDTALTAEDLERHVRLILQSWDKRSIVAVVCNDTNY